MPAYRMSLTMLSPVHIGSGAEIEPTEYVVEQRGQGANANWLFHALDFPRLLGRLSDVQRRTFNQAADQQALFHLRKFIASVVDLKRDANWIAPCNEVVYRAYHRGLENDAAQLVINLMTREANSGRPYIPGSSIKGALRTAWIDRRAAAYAGRGNLDRIRECDFEPEVLGYRSEGDRGRPRNKIGADPFRAVQVGDAALCDGSNCIEPVKIYKPGRGLGDADPAGIQMYYDVTFSRLDGESVAAEGRLVIDGRLPATATRGLRNWSFDHCVAGAIPADELLAACNEFYRPRLEDEITRFAEKLNEPGECLHAEVAAMRPNEALIRLGRFSHVECVTVDRQGGMPVDAEKGTTRSLVAGELPLGWAKISLTPLKG